MAKCGFLSSKRDALFTIACIVFVVANLGAIGSTGRRRAKEMVCLSNLRKWGAMFHKYTQDHNGYFQEGLNGVAGSGDNRWVKALGAYYKWDSKLTCCSEATMPWFAEDGTDMGLAGTRLGAITAWGYYRRTGWMKPVKGSYGINGWVNNPDPGMGHGGKPKEDHWRTPNVKGATFVPLFLGCQRHNAWPEESDEPPAFEGQAWNGRTHMARFCLNRHNGAVGGLFMDWSVRKVGLKELWTLKWHREFNTAGPWTRAGGVLPRHWPAWMRDFKDY